MKKGAVIDSTGAYRYSLHRIWNTDLPIVLFIMLNPSTADALEDDPTIRRCINFAKLWGCGRLEVRNLFAYRATDPRELKRCDDPVGPENNDHIIQAAATAHKIVLAWGTKGTLMGRDREVYKMVAQYKPECLDISKGGHPKHPLFVPAERQPIHYPGEVFR